MRDSTGARIIFPTAEDKDQELITVIGTEEAVAEAQKELEALIKSLVSNPNTDNKKKINKRRIFSMDSICSNDSSIIFLISG